MKLKNKIGDIKYIIFLICRFFLMVENNENNNVYNPSNNHVNFRHN